MSAKQFPLSVVIGAVDNLTAPLRRINNNLRDTFKPVRVLQASLANLSRESGLTGAVRGTVKLYGALDTAAGKAKALAVQIGVIGAGLAYAFTKQFIGTADMFERLTMSLTAIEGGADKAAKSMAFLKKMTVDTPFEMEDLAKTFRTLRGFGIDPTNGTLQSIVDQVAKLGGTGEDLQGIALQLGQAFSKGKLQAQDANILVERGVPVWGMLQRAAEKMGKKVPISQLRKMSEAGQLGQGAILKLIKQMGIESAGASAMMMKSWSGMMSNLSDQWTFFKLRIMQSGAFDWLKGKLQEILDTIDRMDKDGSLQKLADQIGAGLVETLKNLWEISKDVASVMQTLWGAVKAVHDIFDSWKPIIIAVGLVLAGPLLVALVGIGTAVVSLVGSIGLIGTAMIAAVAAVGAGVGYLWAHWDDLCKKVKDAFSAVGDWVKSIWDGVVTYFTDGINNIMEKMRSLANWRPSWWGAASVGAPVGATGAALGGASIAGGRNAVQTNNASVRVEFSNTPPGTSIRPMQNNGVPLQLDVSRMMVSP